MQQECDPFLLYQGNVWKIPFHLFLVLICFCLWRTLPNINSLWTCILRTFYEFNNCFMFPFCVKSRKVMRLLVLFHFQSSVIYITALWIYFNGFPTDNSAIYSGRGCRNLQDGNHYINSQWENNNTSPSPPAHSRNGWQCAWAHEIDVSSIWAPSVWADTYYVVRRRAYLIIKWDTESNSKAFEILSQLRRTI